MNISTSEPSLYQLTQDLDEPLVSLSVGAEALKSYVSSVIRLLIERQLGGTIWVKLPQNKSWHEQIRDLQNEGNARRIFICNSHKLLHHPHLSSNGDSPSFEDKRINETKDAGDGAYKLPIQARQTAPSEPNRLGTVAAGQTTHSSLSYWNITSAKTPVIPIELNQNSNLRRECFLIVLAPDFCSAILAQWQKGKIQIESSGKRLQQPYLEMVSSFDRQAIAPILTGIEQNISSHHNLREEDLKIDPNWQTSSDLCNQLLLHQVKQNENLQTALKSLPKHSQVTESNPTILGLQEDFLNNLIQELRSPITHMKTALSLLESKQIKGEQRQRYLQMVGDQCDRQNSLVSGLLELLQLDSPTEAEYLYLDDIVPGIVSTYQPLAEEKEIQLGYTIPANLPPISCPRSWFRQIIINLLNNSLQFTPPQGRVFVQATPKNNNEYIEILVMDTGRGISSKEITKIFDGFYRTKPIADSKIVGAGLGLTLVRQLIQRAGGSISVNSKVNKGTTFKILMPAVPGELIEHQAMAMGS